MTAIVDGVSLKKKPLPRVSAAELWAECSGESDALSMGRDAAYAFTH